MSGLSRHPNLLTQVGQGRLAVARAKALAPQDDARGNSKSLHPRPQFDLPAPRATRLLQQVQIGLRDRIRIELRIGLCRILRPPRTADAAVYHDMRNVDALRR